ncbi:MAG TPA: DUF1761 domain-containing protein [Terracidiphilus sp.]|jgi:hypothetical protein
MSESRVQHNWWALLVATIVAFLFAAGWYSALMPQWLKGVDRTTEWFKATGVPGWVSPLGAFALTFLMAIAISCVTQLTGPQTPMRGMRVGFLLWLGMIVPAFGTEYLYELRPFMFVINAGFNLVAMVAMGIIIGVWKKKGVPVASPDRIKAVVS